MSLFVIVPGALLSGKTGKRLSIFPLTVPFVQHMSALFVFLKGVFAQYPVFGWPKR